MNQFEPFCTNWIWFDPIWTNFVLFVPIWTSFICFDPNNQSDSSWSNFIQSEQICTILEPTGINLIWFEQIWTSFIQIINLIHLDLFWSNLNQFEPIKFNLIWFFPIRTNFIWFELNYQSDPIWGNLNQFYLIWIFKSETTWEMTRSISKICLSLKMFFFFLKILWSGSLFHRTSNYDDYGFKKIWFKILKMSFQEVRMYLSFPQTYESFIFWAWKFEIWWMKFALKLRMSLNLTV